jgi:hypothetical protein
LLPAFVRPLRRVRISAQGGPRPRRGVVLKFVVETSKGIVRRVRIVVECTRLESGQGVKAFEGSNPSLSALKQNPRFISGVLF